MSASGLRPRGNKVNLGEDGSADFPKFLGIYVKAETLPLRPPGVDVPHYRFVIWHVSKKDEARVAKWRPMLPKRRGCDAGPSRSGRNEFQYRAVTTGVGLK